MIKLSALFASAQTPFPKKAKNRMSIAIAEYVKAGCIPIIPDEGGPKEIVDDKSLEYRTINEAANTLARLVGDDNFRKERLRHCRERAKLFTRTAYEERQQTAIENMLKL